MLTLGLGRKRRREAVACDFCREMIPDGDVESGRSVVLLSRRYCERCLEEAVMRGRFGGSLEPQEPAAPERSAASERDSSFGSDCRPVVAPADAGEDQRAFERYIPPREAELAIRLAGWSGRLAGNLVVHWLDVSEGGVRAIVSRCVDVGDVLEARIGYRPNHETFDVEVAVRNVSPSQKYPGSFVVGFSFVKPSPVLLACIRSAMSLHLAISDRTFRKLREHVEAEESASAPDPALQGADPSKR